ncbi:MAG: ankyrin repeat domain-containing protein [Spirochaetales bacterium]|nr:ankyrin repeat domain-containing protein [Spirochaetales bacterium]
MKRKLRNYLVLSLIISTWFPGCVSQGNGSTGNDTGEFEIAVLPPAVSEHTTRKDADAFDSALLSYLAESPVFKVVPRERLKPFLDELGTDASEGYTEEVYARINEALGPDLIATVSLDITRKPARHVSARCSLYLASAADFEICGSSTSTALIDADTVMRTLVENLEKNRAHIAKRLETAKKTARKETHKKTALYPKKDVTDPAKKMPDTPFTDIETGEPYRISGLEGKIVVLAVFTDKNMFVWETALLDRVGKIYPEVKVFLGFKNTDINRIERILRKRPAPCPVVDVTALCENWPGRDAAAIESRNHLITRKGFLAVSFGELVSSSLGMRDFLASKIEPYMPEGFVKNDVPLSFVETAETNDVELMKKTYTAGTEVDAFEGLYAPLHYAAMHNNLEMAKFLLDKSADMNILSFHNNGPPLSFCASDEKIGITELLLERGANPFLRDYRGKTPYEAAMETGQAKTAGAYTAHLGDLLFLAGERLAYGEIVKRNIRPKMKPDYPFPCSKQHHNACFGFAVKHLYQYMTGEAIDVDGAEKKIGKSRDDLWDYAMMTDLADLYGLAYTWEDSANSLFASLIRGEPAAIQYRYKQGGSWIGHYVAVYSFDEKGVWASESIANKLVRIPYGEVFDESGTRTLYPFFSISRK